MSKKSTLSDIAKTVNLSKSSVSKAISGKPGVSYDAREKIFSIAKELNYPIDIYNQTKNLRKPQSITIIMDREAFSNAIFWVKIIDRIESELKRYDINMIISVTEVDEQNYIESDNYKTDGYIILGLVHENVLKFIETKKLPIVLVDYKLMDVRHDHIRVNNHQGMKDMTKIVLQKGHRNILYMGDINFAASFRERFFGIKDCIDEHTEIKTQLDTLCIARGVKTIDERDVLLAKLNSENAPTVIMCANDAIALECINVLKKAHFKVPEDISVVGFDNISEGNFAEPKLTTVDVSKIDIAFLTVEAMIKKIINPEKNNLLIMIEAKIIERNSLSERREKNE